MRTSGPVENNPEGAESSESAPPTVYVCAYCKREYGTRNHALNCQYEHDVEPSEFEYD